jgi:very-short-patch-repair endonuclease
VGFVPLGPPEVVERNVVRADEAEPRVLGLARRQHGVVSWSQLAGAGVSARWVDLRLARGWLRRLHRGVYLVGPLETEHSRAMAATLAAGPGALVSHYAAAVLWGLRPPADGPIDVTVPGRKTRCRPGIRTHNGDLHPADATLRHGIPVTSAARALLDLAATAATKDVDLALNEAHVQRRVSSHSLTEQFSRYPRHRGTAALREAQRTEPKLTRSEAERRAMGLIRKARLPKPETNVRIAGYEVDLVWREQRLVVEIDGFAFHSSRRSFERDRRKDRELQARGYRVMRITWRELVEEPEAVVAALAAALSPRS